MTFPSKSLNNDESVALDLHPHWWYFAEAGAALLLTIVLGIVLAAVGPGGSVGKVLKYIVIAGLVVSALWLVVRYLKWSTTHFVITSQRVVFRTGIISKSGIEIPLDRVNNVNFHQSIFERILGAGDLLIESGGEDGQSRYSDVRHPDRVQKLIHSQIEGVSQRRAAYPTGASNAGSAPQVDVAEQLERLEGMLTRGSLTQEEFDLQKRKLLGL